MADKVKVLCVLDYYLPGFKGGGPIRTIANLCKSLSGDVEFSIITRDRDLGSDRPYSDIKINEWQAVEGTPVYYADPSSFGPRAISGSGIAQECDMLYLNSFFGYRSSISLLLSSKLSRRCPRNILIAPRGEFSNGALSIKRWKKGIYLRAAKFLGLYENVRWHASTILEAEDIGRVFPRAKDRIYLAADPVSIENTDIALAEGNEKRTGSLKIAFISRISPMKNLEGLLEILLAVSCEVRLEIYGPVEDVLYWERCQEIARSLPGNIAVEYCGALEPNEVSSAFARNDLFAFPTHGENFGHVVFEALRAGTPVLVSDRTPWHAVPSGAITVAPLDALDVWRAHLEAAADRDAEQQRSVRMAAIDYARSYASSDGARSDNLGMFLDMTGASARNGLAGSAGS